MELREVHRKEHGEEKRGTLEGFCCLSLTGKSVHLRFCDNYCCCNVAVPEVPETILPRGHMHRPPLFRHAWDDGSVV
jgi:hypothetical protein